jgi:hypothetical protein
MTRGLVCVVFVVLAIVSQVSVEAFKMNQFRKLLLDKLQDVGSWAQHYMDAHNMPYKTTPDYP